MDPMTGRKAVGQLDAADGIPAQPSSRRRRIHTAPASMAMPITAPIQRMAEPIRALAVGGGQLALLVDHRGLGGARCCRADQRGWMEEAQQDAGTYDMTFRSHRSIPSIGLSDAAPLAINRILHARRRSLRQRRNDSDRAYPRLSRRCIAN